METEATIKIVAPPGPNEGEFICTAEGNGPVNALDNALREALEQVYPHLRDLKLVNYKVRILDEASGTAAVTRVLIDVPMARGSGGLSGSRRHYCRLLGSSGRFACRGNATACVTDHVIGVGSIPGPGL